MKNCFKIYEMKKNYQNYFRKNQSLRIEIIKII